MGSTKSLVFYIFRVYLAAITIIPGGALTTSELF
jgi:hypothetical protein